MVDSEQRKEDVKTVALEAKRKLDRGAADSPRKAVASALGDTIPNDRGDENYKADILVLATDVLEQALDEESPE